MAKLNKMELQAVAGTILKQVKEAKLPQLVTEWEQKKLEVEQSEAWLELQAWLQKYELNEKGIINLYHLNLALGLNQKPTTVAGLPTIQNIVDKLIIGQISDTNITSLIESVKEELLNP
jgi:hypothetical protein